MEYDSEAGNPLKRDKDYMLRTMNEVQNAVSQVVANSTEQSS